MKQSQAVSAFIACVCKYPKHLLTARRTEMKATPCLVHVFNLISFQMQTKLWK